MKYAGQDRIPPAIHLLLATMSILIVVGTMLVHYDNLCAGILVVGAITFVLALYWQVATNLDNPHRGVWYVNEIPSEWRDEGKALDRLPDKDRRD